MKPLHGNHETNMTLFWISVNTHLLWQAFCVTELVGNSAIDDHHPRNGFLQL